MIWKLTSPIWINWCKEREREREREREGEKERGSAGSSFSTFSGQVKDFILIIVSNEKISIWLWYLFDLHIFVEEHRREGRLKNTLIITRKLLKSGEVNLPAARFEPKTFDCEVEGNLCAMSLKSNAWSDKRQIRSTNWNCVETSPSRTQK